MELKRGRCPRSMAMAGMLAVLCVAAILVFIGCGSASPPATVAVENPALPDAKPIVEDSAQRMAVITYASFALHHDVGSSHLADLGLDLQRVEGRIAMPDRFALRMEATPTTQTAFVVVGIIGVGGQTYMSLLGRWGETDAASLPFDFTGLGLRLADIMRAIQDPIVTAEEEVEGVAVWRIEGAVDSGDFRGLLVNASPGRPVALEAWIGKEDSLLHMVRVVGQLFSDDQVDAVRVLTIRDVDVPVSIEAPL